MKSTIRGFEALLKLFPSKRCFCVVGWLIVAAVCLIYFSHAVEAQALEARISDLISNLIRILNLVLVGAIAWTGFLMARGDATALQRLMYAVIGLVVVNSAELIIEYFL